MAAHPAIHQFVQDPLSFLTLSQGSTAVSSYNVFPGRSGAVPREGFFHFVLDHDNGQRRTFEIKYHGPNQTSPNAVRAYNLGYNGGAQTSPRPAFIDIPKKPGPGQPTLLFTGTLSGCSVIVTSLNNYTYRVFHDSRQDSSLFYSNVEMAIDYSEYSVSNPESTACVFMQFRNGQWNMFVQLQTLNRDGGQTISVQRRTQLYQSPQQRYFPLVVMQPGSYNARRIRQDFDARRQANRDKLRRLAAQALPGTPIPNEQDGWFQPNMISLNNPAVRHSQAIREVISRASGDPAGQYVPPRGEYPLVGGVSQWGKVNNKQLVAAVENETRGDDFAYLWIMQKERVGIHTVVVT